MINPARAPLCCAAIHHVPVQAEAQPDSLSGGMLPQKAAAVGPVQIPVRAAVPHRGCTPRFEKVQKIDRLPVATAPRIARGIAAARVRAFASKDIQHEAPVSQAAPDASEDVRTVPSGYSLETLSMAP